MQKPWERNILGASEEPQASDLKTARESKSEWSKKGIGEGDDVVLFTLTFNWNKTVDSVG